MPVSDNDRIRAAFEMAYARKPTQAEMTAVRSFLQEFTEKQGSRTIAAARKQGWTAFCQAIFQAAEFRIVD